MSFIALGAIYPLVDCVEGKRRFADTIFRCTVQIRTRKIEPC